MNKEIKNIRVRLDQLDNKLLKIIKKRLYLVDKVGSISEGIEIALATIKSGKVLETVLS